MFVRVKQVRGRRYAYLVEGVRDGTRVRQRVVCYLGPVPRVALGVLPKLLTDRAGRPIDWRIVREAAARIPLSFEELSDARRYGYPLVLSSKRQGFLTGGTRQRVEGEEDALSGLAASNFKEKFAEVGRNRFRMK
jgi:hypothetical protein